MKKYLLIMFVIITTSISIYHSLIVSAITAPNVLTLTEIMPNPAGTDSDYEWMEFTNFSNVEVNLIDFKLNNVALPNKILASSEIVILARNKSNIISRYGLQNIVEYNFSLSNTSAELTLQSINSSDTQLFQYSNTQEEISIELLDGECGTIKNHSSSNSIGKINTSCLEVLITPSVSVSPTTTLTATKNEKLYITRMNPAPENGKEWIELSNIDKNNISLFNWIVEDESGSQFVISTQDILKPGETILIYPDTLSLNNTGDSIFLLDPDKNVRDIFKYSESSKGFIAEIYSKSENLGISSTTNVVESSKTSNSSGTATNPANSTDELKELKIYRLGEYPEFD